MSAARPAGAAVAGRILAVRFNIIAGRPAPVSLAVRPPEAHRMGLLDWFRQRPPVPPEKPPKLPEGVSAHDAGGPEFIGQQQGVAADLLPAEFRPALSALPQVQRAYFCKLRYPGEERPGAAVCVASSAGEDLQVVEALSAVIRANLRSGSHIDLLFLSASLEAKLSGVCPPFYKQAEPGAAAD